MYRDALKEFGLNDREADVYLALLKEQHVTASQIAKTTSVHRSTVYLELENLMQRGLASYVVKQGVRYYRPAPPQKFIDLLEEQKQQFQEVLPQLQGLHSELQPFSTQVYEGKQGIKTFYQDIYNNTQDFQVLGATGKATQILKYSYPHVITRFTKKGITERAIANAQAKEVMQEHPQEFVKVKYLPADKPAQVTTVIYADKIAIQSLQENIYVVVIKDQQLHETYKNHFELLWSLL